MREISSWLMWGDCMRNLQLFHDEYFDCLVTDPPYGLQFMGKRWDKAVVGVDVWRECFRVLKAGSFAFIMSAPRLDCLSHMAVNLSDAGFEIGFSPMYWTYGSGFPKSMNISKAVDKRLGFKRKEIPATGLLHKNVNLNDDEWKKIGSDSPMMADNIPVSSQAKRLDGAYAGCQLKPAVEVVIVAMKPLSEKSYVDQALKDGKGVTWLDHCRIPFESNMDKSRAEGARKWFAGKSFSNGSFNFNNGAFVYDSIFNVKNGRFPANLLVSDNVLDDGRVTKSPSGTVNRNPRNRDKVFNDANCGFRSEANTMAGYGDSGGFSRYFDLDAWFVQKLADEGIRLCATFPFLVVPKSSPSEKNNRLQCSKKTRETDGSIRSNPETARKYGANPTRKQNFHPTVKPIRLLSYLVVMGSRKGDTVLDPFVGSGSTMIAAEMMERSVVGMELQPRYYELAKSRLQGRVQEYLDYKVKYLFT